MKIPSKISMNKLLCAVLILGLVIPFVMPLKKAQAIWGVQDTVVVTGDVSPTGISNAITHKAKDLKDFVLDKAAQLVAKQILHQITLSIIDWINNGFHGSPAFMNNPEAFFLDAADQVTGAFLATDGPLSSLCSPFAIDIRLSLALNQVSLPNARYECTLSRIIEAQKNGPDITVNGQVLNSSKTYSMDGFYAGDFSQGGWNAWVEMTTKPANNKFGSFLTAQSDLDARLLNKQNRIQLDLQMGSGFMSWENCKDVPEGSKIDVEADGGVEKVSELKKIPGSKEVNNTDGTVSVQRCEIQTPGSTIANSLHTAMNVPIVELELANDINAIINATISALINKVLQEGLHAISGNSGTGSGYVQKIIDEEARQAESVQVNLQRDTAPAIAQVQQVKAVYDRAVASVGAVQKKYESLKVCSTRGYSNPNGSGYGAYGFMSSEELDTILATEINPLLEDMMAKQKQVATDIEMLKNIIYSTTGTGSTTLIYEQAQKYTEFVRNGGLSPNRVNDAKDELESANKQAEAWASKVSDMDRLCRINPGNQSTPGNQSNQSNP
jgi:hypothetical protein